MRARVRLRRRWQVLAGVLAVLVVAWAVGVYLVVIDPRTESPQPADAIVVLGGASVDGRLQRGLSLAEAGLASTVLISQPPGSSAAVYLACHNPPAGVHVTCFVPAPTTTQGEAREIRRMAAAQGWHKIIVVTSQYHISRARLIIRRCYSGELLMVDANPPSLAEWAYNVAYQTGAYVKALVDSGC